jgi:hypothetical protein
MLHKHVTRNINNNSYAQFLTNLSPAAHKHFHIIYNPSYNNPLFPVTANFYINNDLIAQAAANNELNARNKAAAIALNNPNKPYSSDCSVLSSVNYSSQCLSANSIHSTAIVQAILNQIVDSYSDRQVMTEYTNEYNDAGQFSVESQRAILKQRRIIQLSCIIPQNQFISQSLQSLLISAVRASGEFSPSWPLYRDRKINRLINEYSVDKAVCRQLRQILVRDVARINSNNLYRDYSLQARMREENELNQDINVLGKDYDIPAEEIQRFLSSNTFDNKSAQAINNNTRSYHSGAVNSNRYVLSSNAQSRSLQLEGSIQNFLKRQKIRFINQNTLKHLQQSDSNLPTATPDIVLLDELRLVVEVEGRGERQVYQNINWLECKNSYGFYGSYINHLNEAALFPSCHSLQSQCNRYITYYGSGALIFSSAYCESLQHHNLIANSIPILTQTALLRAINQGEQVKQVDD